MPIRNPPTTPDISFVQRQFLSALSVAEKAGLGGKALNIYNDVVQRGRKTPITEADFDKQTLQEVKEFVLEQQKRTGKTSGTIDYKDYPKFNDTITNTLGGFRYNINGTEIEIDDVYDFNVSRAGAGEDSPLAHIFAAFFAPRELAAAIGRKTIPDKNKQGIPVKIKIGF